MGPKCHRNRRIKPFGSESRVTLVPYSDARQNEATNTLKQLWLYKHCLSTSNHQTDQRSTKIKSTLNACFLFRMPYLTLNAL